ncbi:hypothetical protein Athai_41150 [Actinocatenispora thailandica]|uniref:DUF6875 domain-containing protein n=1 Tax=Actinocatenispora thailandica TaxID=227318 RepID=A0A7R7DRS6_9ACTN|nr:hypothetical protein [Actinocatenispora thailandica]BCJ36612.1 hypothetical protein Athai_41150 [Actinocatenispora thailandica]
MPSTDPGHDDPPLWSAADIDAGLVDDERLRTVLAWSRRFLTAGHAELGRPGPVCPYAGPSLRRDLFRLSVVPGVVDAGQVAGLLDRCRERFGHLAAAVPERDAELVAILVVLPDFDHDDSGPLDDLQRSVKHRFVSDGLMVGQFHPRCPEPGLWRRSFRPLRSPVPLIAIRRMMAGDMPFMLRSEQHLAAYLARFAPQLPARIRDQLSAAAVQGPPAG